MTRFTRLLIAFSVVWVASFGTPNSPSPPQTTAVPQNATLGNGTASTTSMPQNMTTTGVLNTTNTTAAKAAPSTFTPPHPASLIEAMLGLFITGIALFVLASFYLFGRVILEGGSKDCCDMLDDDTPSQMSCGCICLGIIFMIAFGITWGVLRCENSANCGDTENGGAYRRGGIYYGSSYAARRGGGSCFPAFTMIAAESGFKKIENVQVGDVLAWNTRVQAVHTFVHYFDNETLYLYRRLNDEIIVAADHVIYENGKWIYVRDSIHARGLTVSDARRELRKRGIPIGKDSATGNEWITLYNFDTDSHVLPLAYDFFSRNLTQVLDGKGRTPVFSDFALMDELDDFADDIAANISGIEVLEVNQQWKIHTAARAQLSQVIS